MATTKIKRNKPFMRRWVKALRSGKYAQTEGTLCRVEKDHHGSTTAYCCLGVACHISSKIRSKRENLETKYSFITDRYAQGASGLLTPPMLEYIGITEKEMNVLIGMNDRGNTFSLIADKIESWIA